ncbi:type II toxin-antitoxin system VapB family antitoxin [Enterovirga aerilata]|uniref:Type II toxin-antitoxin system VapB family antitoxin n=1 Tax=Enterovirga aerilata TaxID=2730920 RepID=A0A849IAD6_9HYPH|nr:type II toxin-antitoxin system VapB family antitoxin [Enterovirga sp. DB1703]NNM70923.1 type II toxin-antitoxin system VapB family antitoxin [Enterovirga sp. DB1703]
MALHIRDAETDQLVRRLAEIKKLGLTEAVKLAVENELKRVPLSERIRPIQDRIAAMRDTGLKADKAFFDELSGE